MSTTEILRELPKLTEAERRTVREKLLELAREQDEIAVCDEGAIAGAQMLDRLEEEDARRATR